MRTITTRDELRTLYKTPGERAASKEIAALDHHCRKLIAASPIVLIGSSDGNGNADVSPKGDRPGFVAVLDDVTLAIPDRPGNNRLDTFENILVNPSVGLLFLVPGMAETLRVNGDARLTADRDLRERFAVDGKLPIAVMLVTVKTTYMHCAKAFMRSELWKPESWPDRASLPTLGEILADHCAIPGDPAETDQSLAVGYKLSMW